MSINNFLITYKAKGKFHYDWLESEEEVREFIEINELEKEDIIDAIEIVACREIEL